MNDRNRMRYPFPRPDPRRALQEEGQPLGFVQTVEEKVRQLCQMIEGMKDRLKYKYREGVPVSYIGEKVFTPETFTFNVDSARVREAGVEPVNYIIRDAVRHTVPVILEGPGVFLARYLRVEFYQRVLLDSAGSANIPRRQPVRYTIPQTKSTIGGHGTGAGFLVFQTGKISLAAGGRSLSSSGDEYISDRNQIGTNYFWNLIDRDSDRQLSTELISSHVLMPGSWQNELDANLFEFEVPWLFERAGQIDFLFQLINPILQLDPTSATFPFNDIGDDREGNGNIRNQEVTVRVELHGTKFYNERDMLLREAVHAD